MVRKHKRRLKSPRYTRMRNKTITVGSGSKVNSAEVRLALKKLKNYSGVVDSKVARDLKAGRVKIVKDKWGMKKIIPVKRINKTTGKRLIVDKYGKPYNQKNNPENYYPDGYIIDEVVEKIYGYGTKWDDLGSEEMEQIIDDLINDHYTSTVYDYR